VDDKAVFRICISKEGPPILAIPEAIRAELLIGKDAPTCAAIERVAPERLYREAAGTHGDIGRRALAGADPGTLVTVLYFEGWMVLFVI
jgi:hypothetical protein